MNIDPTVAFAWYVVFLFSVTLHEAAHAWAAKHGGDLTAYFGGQVSLDPMPHIRRETIGMVVLPIASLLIFGFPLGYASAPYDPVWAERHPRRAAWMALAGPGANLAIFLLAFVVFKVGLGAGLIELIPGNVKISSLFTAVGEEVWVQKGVMLFSMILSLNLLLFLFNMIPLPPMDGSAALPLVVGESAARRFNQWFANPGFALMGLFIAWHIIPVIFNFSMEIVLRLF